MLILSVSPYVQKIPLSDKMSFVPLINVRFLHVYVPVEKLVRKKRRTLSKLVRWRQKGDRPFVHTRLDTHTALRKWTENTEMGN